MQWVSDVKGLCHHDELAAQLLPGNMLTLPLTLTLADGSKVYGTFSGSRSNNEIDGLGRRKSCGEVSVGGSGYIDFQQIASVAIHPPIEAAADPIR